MKHIIEQGNTYIAWAGCITAIVAAIVACSITEALDGQESDRRVQWVGAQRRVVRDGDLGGQIDLETLSKRPHLYAVGPLEGLKGEVSVFDGSPFITRLEDGKVIVDRSFRHKACFLVYAQIDRWQDLEVPETVKTAVELGEFVWLAASKRLDVTKPFPFLLKGKPSVVDFHIVNKIDNLPHNPELHEKVKVHLQLKGQPVEIIGFFSDKHQGVFTHHNSKVHMHVKTTDGTTGGHVDDLHPYGGLTLLLPKIN
jgi:acetolactate decarboxylase